MRRRGRESYRGKGTGPAPPVPAHWGCRHHHLPQHLWRVGRGGGKHAGPVPRNQGACPGAAASRSPRALGAAEAGGGKGRRANTTGANPAFGVQTRGLSRRRGARRNSARAPPKSPHTEPALYWGGGGGGALNKKANHAVVLPLPEAIRTHPPYACRPQALGK